MVQHNKITQENDSHLITIISYLQVVDDGDGVVVPADHHGANLGPGSVLCIELQDVVSVGVATCIMLYHYTNCIGNSANHKQSPGYHCLYLLSPLYCPEWRPSDSTGVRGEQRRWSRRWRRGGGGVQCWTARQSCNHRSPAEPLQYAIK